MAGNSITKSAGKISDAELGIRWGKSNLPISMWKRIADKYRYRWGQSLLRTVLREFYIGLPLRIVTILRTPEVRLGPTIPLSLSGHNLKTLYPVNSF